MTGVDTKYMNQHILTLEYVSYLTDFQYLQEKKA